MTTEQLCNELPSWHCGLKQSSNHLVKDRWKIRTVSALLASKIFLARIWQKMDACTQKVWNNRMSSLKSYCSHFVIHHIKACIILHMLAPHTKQHLLDFQSLLLSLRQEVPSVKKTRVRVLVCVSVYAFLAGLSKYFGIHFREDKWTLNKKSVEKREKHKIKQKPKHGKNYLIQNYCWQS